jgi:DNA-binding response OmpR family regulator
MKKKPIKILVVDDEPDLTFGCSMTLKLHGFEVDTFNDPLIALSVFKPDTYNLVLLDVKMPKMDGFTLYNEIKKIDNKANICFLTASEFYYEQFRKEEFSNLDKELFIQKPIENHELIKRINNILEKINK